MDAHSLEQNHIIRTPASRVALIGATAGIAASLLVGVIGFALVEPVLSPTVSPAINAPAEDTVVSVAAYASPAVVSIVSTRGIAGSGFIISEDGYIVTNHHVLADPFAQYAVLTSVARHTVMTSDGVEYEAVIVASDAVMDVALLKISANNLPFLEFGDSDEVVVGQSVIAIGNALGQFNNTVSVGVISGLARNIIAADSQGDAERLYDLIQTDAAINAGNSGGPLLDLHGKVVGVNVAATLGMTENIGFAIPSNAVQRVIEVLQRSALGSQPATM